MSRRLRDPDTGWPTTVVEVRVQYADVDAMRVVWHGHYVRYLEAAREVAFRRYDLCYSVLADLGWAAPVVQMQLEYLQSARCGDLLQVAVAVMPSDTAAIDLAYAVRRDGTTLCRARTRQLVIDAGGTAFVTRPPELERFFQSAQGSRP